MKLIKKKEQCHESRKDKDDNEGREKEREMTMKKRTTKRTPTKTKLIRRVMMVCKEHPKIKSKLKN